VLAPFRPSGDVPQLMCTDSDLIFGRVGHGSTR
jgi:hypothetical protein